MNDRDDPAGAETQAATSESSPYRSPPVVDEDSNQRPELVRRATIAPAATAGYAFAAAVLSVVAILGMEALFAGPPTAIAPVMVVSVPMLLIGLFCGRAIAVTGSLVPTAAKSLGWKALMIIVAAPVSLVVFVPTCAVVSGPFVMMTVAGGGFGVIIGIFIGYFVAYLVTFHLVTAAVRSRMTSGVRLD